MSNCSECNVQTLGPGVCCDCSEKRIFNYPTLKREKQVLEGQIENIRKILEPYPKGWFDINVPNDAIGACEKIKAELEKLKL